MRKGLLTEAEAEYEAAGSAHLVAFCQALRGDTASALDVIEDFLVRGQTEWVNPMSIATIYVGVGDLDKAFSWLDSAYAHRTDDMSYLAVRPEWDGVRHDPRFLDLLRRLGLPQ
jgi:hypothetical protein